MKHDLINFHPPVLSLDKLSGLTELELKRESELGQTRSSSPTCLMAALGCKADSISDGPGVRS